MSDKPSQEDHGFLVLTRKYGESLLLDGRIAIRIDKRTHTTVKIAIYAPRSVKIDRLECTDFKLPERKG